MGTSGKKWSKINELINDVKYDYNGRRVKKAATSKTVDAGRLEAGGEFEDREEAEEDQEQIERAGQNDEEQEMLVDNASDDSDSNKGDNRNGEEQEIRADGLIIPDWLKYPFKSRAPSSSSSEHSQHEVLSNEDKEETKPTTTSKHPRNDQKTL